MATMAENVIAAGSETRPSMLEKGMNEDLVDNDKLCLDSDIKGARVSNTVGNARANQLRVVTCYNCNGEGHIAKQCTVKKRVKDSEWFTDKMLLAQAQDAGVVLNEELQDFLADNYDDEATTNAIFMENLSPIGSLNDDTVEPRYDSDILSKVPHYENYHDSDMLNFNIQEVGYIENIISNNESYDELTSNSNVISYTDYMLNIDEVFLIWEGIWRITRDLAHLEKEQDKDLRTYTNIDQVFLYSGGDGFQIKT
ncbi:retrovirus-related pol polyprotein from transposon TNT 1-94 [Tanacetum coccineum]